MRANIPLLRNMEDSRKSHIVQNVYNIYKIGKMNNITQIYTSDNGGYKIANRLIDLINDFLFALRIEANKKKDF